VTRELFGQILGWLFLAGLFGGAFRELVRHERARRRTMAEPWIEPRWRDERPRS
jgi:hypothetical protein